MILLLIAYCTSFVAARHGIFSWVLRARREKARLLSSYNNSSSPRRDTGQLCGDW
jgi:hypothetical protein